MKMVCKENLECVTLRIYMRLTFVPIMTRQMRKENPECVILRIYMRLTFVPITTRQMRIVTQLKRVHVNYV